MSRHARRRTRLRGTGMPLLPVVTLALAMLGSLAALVVGVLGPAPPGGSPEPAPAAAPGPAPDLASDMASDAVLVREATSALRTWDRARARAWASADLAALRGLYADGSDAGAVDVAMLRQWRRRGLAVEGLRTQVIAVRVLEVAAPGADGRPDQLVLAVTDRLAGGHAVPVAATGRRAAAVPLPTGDQPTDRAVTLRSDDGGVWRVVEVRPLGPEADERIRRGPRAPGPRG
ncbi:hypothetical protein [Nocardioides nanhaiensis]|uniref:Uncharacterized protein n=1 Tax=Nocardioides nanhaiensis TaxID=1476871 RepID=A0ABP8X0L7_9ACTN